MIAHTSDVRKDAVCPIDSSVLENECSTDSDGNDTLRRARSLGIITNSSTGQDQNAGLHTSEQDSWRAEQYQLLEAARGLLPRERVAACLQFSIPGKQAELHFNAETGKASIHNVAHCGSVWTCPICSGRINRERGEEIQRAMSNITALGGTALLVTLTLQHDRRDGLELILDELQSGWAGVTSGGSWSRFKERRGVIAYVKATEILHGSNGWHGHLHVLVFSSWYQSKTDIAEIGDWFSDRWSLKVAQAGGYASERYGVVVSCGESAAKYLTKWTQRKNWDVSRELTSRRGKTVRSGRSPFQLVEDFRAGDVEAGHLFREYAEVTKGRRQMTRSHRFGEVLLVDVDLSKQTPEQKLHAEAARRDREDASRVVLTLTNKQYDFVMDNRLVPALLRVVEETRGDAMVTWAWLIMQGLPVERPKPDAQRDAAFEEQRRVRKERRKDGGG